MMLSSAAPIALGALLWGSRHAGAAQPSDAYADQSDPAARWLQPHGRHLHAPSPCPAIQARLTATTQDATDALKILKTATANKSCLPPTSLPTVENALRRLAADAGAYLKDAATAQQKKCKVAAIPWLPLPRPILPCKAPPPPPPPPPAPVKGTGSCNSLTFVPSPSTPLGPPRLGAFAADPAVGDLNGDGRGDVALSAVAGGQNTVIVFLGQADGSFTTSATFRQVPGFEISAGVFADFIAGGPAELALGTLPGSDFKAAIEVYSVSAPDTPRVTSLPGRQQVGFLRAADFTGTGGIDLAYVDNVSGNLNILAGDGTGLFNPTPIFTQPATVSSRGMEVVDLNGDGLLDIVATGRDAYFNVILNTGNGFVGSTVALPSAPLGLTAADINKDGKPDVVTGLSEGLFVSLGTGDGTFASAIAASTPISFPLDVVAADFDCDGLVDLATVTPNGAFTVRNLGAGAFGPPVLQGSGVGHDFLATADFNGDGSPDLVITEGGSGQGTVLLNGCTACQTPVVG